MAVLRKTSISLLPRVSLAAPVALLLLLSSALTASAQPWRKPSANGQAGATRAAVTIHKLAERLLYAGTGKLAPLRRGAGAAAAEISHSAESADSIGVAKNAASAESADPLAWPSDLPRDATPQATRGIDSPRANHHNTAAAGGGLATGARRRMPRNPAVRRIWAEKWRKEGAGQQQGEVSKQQANERNRTRSAAAAAAAEAELKRVVVRKAAVGFPGINQKTLVTSGSPPKYNRSMIRVTPPDVVMCVGNGFILHTVNSAMVVYNTKGRQLTAITPHHEFFNALPYMTWKGSIEASIRGDSIGDMTCVYDRRAKRFYLATYWTSGGSKNAYDRFGQTRRRGGGETVGSGLLVAASTTSNPTQPWNLFFIPASNDGKNSNADFRPPLNLPTQGLVTFMDYPQTGADAYGFYVSANHFSYEDSGYFGVSIYAISKVQLSRPRSTFILRIAIPTNSDPTTPDYTVWPQKVAADSAYDTSNGGTMYFGYNEDATGTSDFSPVTGFTYIGAFLITGTGYLGTKRALSLVQTYYAAVSSSGFYTPGLLVQKWGPVPLAWVYGTTIKPIDPSTTDVRGVVVDAVKKQMWMTFTTGATLDLLPFVVVARLRMTLVPQRKWQPLRVVLERFKWVGVKGNGLIQPSVALNRHGKGIIATSLAGPSYYPSAAYATLNADAVVGDVVVAGAGAAALDDYSGYMGFGAAVRYGDYMTAAIDEEGNAWGAVQYVPGRPRSYWSNWATYIFKVVL